MLVGRDFKRSPKPVELDQFIEVVKSIDSFWFSIVNLPPNGET